MGTSDKSLHDGNGDRRYRKTGQRRVEENESFLCHFTVSGTEVLDIVTQVGALYGERVGALYRSQVGAWHG